MFQLVLQQCCETMSSVFPDLKGSKLYISLYLTFHQVKFTSLQVVIVMPVPNGTFSLPASVESKYNFPVS